MIDEEFWIKKYSQATPKQLATELTRIAKGVRLSQLRKSKRGPKKLTTPRTRFQGTPHVSTYKLLNNITATEDSNA